jgi:hypothetical protein
VRTQDRISQQDRNAAVTTLALLSKCASPVVGSLLAQFSWIVCESRTGTVGLEAVTEDERHELLDLLSLSTDAAMGCLQLACLEHRSDWRRVVDLLMAVVRSVGHEYSDPDNEVRP